MNTCDGPPDHTSYAAYVEAARVVGEVGEGEQL
jgi:hypothetical protein